MNFNNILPNDVDLELDALNFPEYSLFNFLNPIETHIPSILDTSAIPTSQKTPLTASQEETERAAFQEFTQFQTILPSRQEIPQFQTTLLAPQTQLRSTSNGFLSSPSNQGGLMPGNDTDSLVTNAATFASGTANVTPPGINEINALLAGWKWPGKIITYSFIKDGDLSSDLQSELDEITKGHVRHILENVIEPLIGIDFLEIDETEYFKAQISYNYSSALPDTTAGLEFEGGILLNPKYSSGFQAGPGDYYYQTLIHETLHALGLKHSGNYDGDGLNDSPPFLPEDEDHWTNTVMTYSNHGVTAPAPITPMVYDIMALQHLYGVNKPNPGDTAYNFERVDAYEANGQFWGGAPSSSGEPLPVKQTIVDGDGINIFDFQKLSPNEDYIIDINFDGSGIVTTQSDFNTLSYTHYVSGETYQTHGSGTSIALGTYIANVTGSPGNDTIIGNAFPNTLIGLEGNDELTGGHEKDVLLGGDGDDILRGSISVSPPSSIHQSEVDVLSGGEGADTFVIGDPGSISYYLEGDVIAVGYARVLDFNPHEGDVVQLSGTRGDYKFININSGSASAMYIFHIKTGVDDLVANLDDVDVNTLNLETDVVFV